VPDSELGHHAGTTSADALEQGLPAHGHSGTTSPPGDETYAPPPPRRHMEDFAATWTATTLDPDLPDLLGKLRRRLRTRQRADLINQVRNANRANGQLGGW
jgi:hypothetical protein